MSSRRLPALVALVVSLVGLVAVLAFAPRGATEVPARAQVPSHLPGLSRLTAAEGDHPVGRGLALYPAGHDSGDVLLAGSDGRSVRHLETAASAPVSLSPDGTLVAIGDRDEGDITVLDVGSGEVRTVSLPEPGAVVPLAWSPDARRLAYLSPDLPVGPGTQAPGSLVVLDVASGRAQAVPGADDVVAAAFSPGGTRLAVQAPDSGIVRLLDPETGLGEEVPVPVETRLAGGAAWSPDGALLALRDGTDRIRFVGTRPGVTAPDPVPGVGDVLGWTSATVVVHAVAPDPTLRGADDVRIVATDALSGRATPFTIAPPAGDGDVSLAYALLPHAAPAPGGPVDRGPWPLGLRLAVVVLAAGLAVPATLGLRRRLDQVRHLSAAPEWARHSTPG